MIDSSSSTSRITTMKWINGGYESLLMVRSVIVFEFFFLSEILFLINL